ncbi:MAG: hypothetical protein JXA07_16530 [Spirochaetes bacterium]|nr:hypothetical protein [Spirochaetota bacterium]
MKAYGIAMVAAIIIFCALFAGCSRALITAPAAAYTSRWEIVLAGLGMGPDRYSTARGDREPRRGRRFLWARLRITNRLKTKQEFLLKRIILTADGKRVRPSILDMGVLVSLRANPAPVCAPGETISRKIIYTVPADAVPEKISYEKVNIMISESGQRADAGRKK